MRRRRHRRDARRQAILRRLSWKRTERARRRDREFNFQPPEPQRLDMPGRMRTTFKGIFPLSDWARMEAVERGARMHGRKVQAEEERRHRGHPTPKRRGTKRRGRTFVGPNDPTSAAAILARGRTKHRRGLLT